MARERSGVTFRAPRLRTLAGSVRSDRPTQRDEALPVRARPGTGLLVVAPPRHERERRFLNLDLVRDLKLNLGLNLDLEWTWTWSRPGPGLGFGPAPFALSVAPPQAARRRRAG